MLNFLHNLSCYIRTLYEIKSKNRDFLKHKLKDIYFCTLKLFSFHKVVKKLSEAKTVALKKIIER